jgi:SAM-dependent methyltransferase
MAKPFPSRNSSLSLILCPTFRIPQFSTPVSIVSALKKYVPEPLRPCLRTLKRVVTRSKARLPTYADRVKTELRVFTAEQNVHGLPAISHYWSNKHLIPMLEPLGFRNSLEMFRLCIARVCSQYPGETCRVLSIASGDSAPEINIAEWLLENGIHNFRIECCDINEEVLARGRRSAADKGVDGHFDFVPADINLWEPQKSYHVVLAIQCLHHIVELESLFDRIHRALHPSGFFAADDMIGRNGHQRWPEAMKHVNRLWKDLPDNYKHNRVFGTFDKKVDNRDYSEGCFEGIRSQDILPLLVQRFHFDAFVGFGNIVDVFIDRGYGPNFDPEKAWDREFIDRVHALDVQEIDAGRVKPTHVYAAMTRTPLAQPRFPRHWSPEFCVRHP